MRMQQDTWHSPCHERTLAWCMHSHWPPSLHGPPCSHQRATMLPTLHSSDNCARVQQQRQQQCSQRAPQPSRCRRRCGACHTHTIFLTRAMAAATHPRRLPCCSRPRPGRFSAPRLQTRWKKAGDSAVAAVNPTVVGGVPGAIASYVSCWQVATRPNAGHRHAWRVPSH